MAKILHLFRAEKFTNGYINFVNENFTKDDHEFWIYGNRTNVYTQVKLCAHKNAKHVKNIVDKLNDGEIQQFDKIIYHGVFDQSIIDFLVKNRKLLDKLYLYFWGGDKFYVKDKWGNAKKKYVVRNAHGIINIIPEEHRYMMNYYHCKGNYFCAQYASDNIINNLQRHREGKANREVVSILLGNSSAATNHHIPILHKLAIFKNEKIMIYVPLSYGNGKEYILKVIEEGKRIFGEKFVAVNKFMDEDEYYDFLNDMDIGIFDMNRQQALGNIMAMLTFGKKVYLRNHSVLSHYFSVENRCIVYKTEDIERLTFADFVYFEDTNAEKNKEIMKQIYCKEPHIREWEMIFSEKI